LVSKPDVTATAEPPIEVDALAARAAKAIRRGRREEYFPWRAALLGRVMRKLPGRPRDALLRWWERVLKAE
jgi:hypothetical protein